MEINSYSILLAYFIIYSFLGWVLESIYKSILQKEIVNSGFINGPFCPIYGFGAIILYLFLDNFKDNLVMVFLIGVVTFSVWEYFVGVFLEKMFNTRYWDYDNEKFNFQGRICLKMSLAWGLLGLFFTYVLHPLISQIVLNIPINFLNPILAVLLMYLIIDFVISSIKIKNIAIKFSKLKEIQNAISVKIGELKNLQLQDIKTLANTNMQLDSLKNTIAELKQTERVLKYKLYKRIVRLKLAFPTIKSKIITDFLNQKFDNIKKEKKER